MIPYAVKPEKVIWIPRPKGLAIRPFIFQSLPQRKVKKIKKLNCLLDFASDPSLQPSLMIFHMGRGGSTLLSQFFRADPSNLVLSEPGCIGGFHQILLSDHYSKQNKISLLRGLINSFSSVRVASEKRTVFKFSTVANYGLEYYLKAAPLCPYIFIHREPLEIILSYLKGPPMIMEHPFSDFGKKEVNQEFLQFLIRYLIGLYESFERKMDKRAIVLNYNQLNAKNAKALYEIFGFEWTPQVEQSINKEMGLYSKDASRTVTFSGDQKPPHLMELIKSEKVFIERELLPLYKKFQKKEFKFRV